MSRSNIKAILRKIEQREAQKRLAEGKPVEAPKPVPAVRPTAVTRPYDRSKSALRHQPGPGGKGRIILQEFSHGRTHRVIALSKSEAASGPRVFKSKFVPSKSGGLMADMKVDGKVVFPDSRGIQPANDGNTWSFYITGKNPKDTVRFAQIVVGAPKVVISASGKIICTNRKPALIEALKTVRMPKFRTPPVEDVFAFGDDDYDFDRYSRDYDYGCDGDDGDDDEVEASNDDNDIRAFIQEEIAGIESTLRPATRKNSACWSMTETTDDGTGTDWVPRNSFAA